MTPDSQKRLTTPPELLAKFRQAYTILAQPKSDLTPARDLLLTCSQGDPDNLIFVETFLHILPRVPPLQSWWRKIGTRIAMRHAGRRQDWDQYVHHGLGLLAVCPNDATLLCQIGDAMQQRDAGNVGMQFFLAATQVAHDHLDIWRRCGRAFARAGNYDRAHQCWMKVVQLCPDDKEALDSIDESQGIMRDEPPAKSIPMARSFATFDNAGDTAGAPHLLDRDQLFAEIARLTAEGANSPALELLHRATQANPGDLKIAERWEDMRLDSIRNHVESVRRHAPASDGSSEVEQLESNLNRLEIEIYGARAARYPQEHRWKMRLGACLQRARNYAAACQIYTEIPLDEYGTQKNTTKIHLAWGECLQHLHRFQEALRHYEMAAVPMPGDDQNCPTELLMAYYRAGVLSLHLGELTRAHTYLHALASVDPSYKDCRQHLDKLHSIRDKDGFSQDTSHFLK